MVRGGMLFTECLCPQHSYVKILNPSELREILGHEGGASGWNWSPDFKKIQNLSLSLSLSLSLCLSDTVRKQSSANWDVGLPLGCRHHDLGLLASRTVKNKCVFCKMLTHSS
jgi:hypothetical protein